MHFFFGYRFGADEFAVVVGGGGASVVDVAVRFDEDGIFATFVHGIGLFFTEYLG